MREKETTHAILLLGPSVHFGSVKLHFELRDGSIGIKNFNLVLDCLSLPFIRRLNMIFFFKYIFLRVRIIKKKKYC